MWLIFVGLVLALLAFALGILTGRDRESGVKESLRLSAFYITIALLFGGTIFHTHVFGKPDRLISLGVTLTLIAGGVIVSLVKTGSEGKRLPAE